MESEILKKLVLLKRYALTRHSYLKRDVDDLISFAFIQYKKGRSLKTPFYYLVCDYQREEHGGKGSKGRVIPKDMESRDNQYLIGVEPKQEIKDEDLYVLLEEALVNTPKRLRVMLLMLEGKNNKEISKIIGCSESNVTLLMKNAIQSIKDYARNNPRFKSLAESCSSL